MKILIIGGTKFLGRHLVTAAQARSHEITIFHRGNHPAENIKSVEEIYGDRNNDLHRLKNGNWDVVLDTCGYLPQTVKASAEALANFAEQYVFVSSVSAYAGFSEPNYSETAPLATLTCEQASDAAKIDVAGEITAAGLGEMYGALKALCERAVQHAFSSRALIVRPGLIVGPLDPTDRFTYWVSRVARGGQVLVPGTPSRFVQFIDARDLAEWIIGTAERKAAGVYNVAGKPFALTFIQLLEEIKAVSRSSASFAWVDEAFLKREAVEDWQEMPLYLAESSKEKRGFLSANIDKAIAENLRFRPLAETIGDTLAWRATQRGQLKAGINFAKEQELLRRWHEELPS